METWRNGEKETWTWRYGHEDMDMETWPWRHGIKTWGNSDVLRENQTEKGSPDSFPSSVYRFLIMQTEVCRLSMTKNNQTEVIRLQTD
jgi:hypothetical protein